MFSISPFSADVFSSLGISNVEAVSLIEAIATIESVGSLNMGATSSIEGAAILDSKGTLTIGGSSAQLDAVADILANATVRGENANIFIWTVPERGTTWSFPDSYNGDKLIWVIPVDAGISIWNFSEQYSGKKLIWTIPPDVGQSTWTLPN
jgi:hypothetical protein